MADVKALTSRVDLTLAHTHTLTRDSDLSVITDPLSVSYSDTLATGTGTDQADLVYHDQVVATVAGSTTLDLSALSSDAFGDDIAFVTIKEIYIRSVSGSALVLGAAASNPLEGANTPFTAAGSTSTVPAAGVWFVYSPTAGYTVTDNSADQLKITYAAAATFNIVIVGTSA